MKCHECGQAEMETARKSYHYRECGLDNVTLAEVVVQHCPSCGTDFVSIPAMASLHQAIALTLIEKTEALSAKEIGFLRRSLGWSSDDLAAYMHVDVRTVKRWENNDAPQSMGNPAEVLLRSAVARDLRYLDSYGVEKIRSLSLKPATSTRRFHMKQVDSMWTEEQAA
jgi:putative zinc finger/helix-turn-helix YgiT family protein